MHRPYYILFTLLCKRLTVLPCIAILYYVKMLNLYPQRGGIHLKLKSDFLLKTVAGSKIVVPIGEASASFNGVITLSSSAAFLWEKLQAGATEEELLDALLMEYDVERDFAAADLKRFIAKLQSTGMLEEE